MSPDIGDGAAVTTITLIGGREATIAERSPTPRDQPLARTHDGKCFMLIDLEPKEQTFIGIVDGEIVESEFPPWPGLDPESKSLRAVEET